MSRKISRFFTSAVLGAALAGPVALTPTMLRADDKDRVYRDKDHNEEHHWDAKEDRAYRAWAKENHRKYTDFSKLREEDQQQYWNWRREHSDDVRKVEH